MEKVGNIFRLSTHPSTPDTEGHKLLLYNREREKDRGEIKTETAELTRSWTRREGEQNRVKVSSRKYRERQRATRNDQFRKVSQEPPGLHTHLVSSRHFLHSTRQLKRVSGPWSGLAGHTTQVLDKYSFYFKCKDRIVDIRILHAFIRINGQETTLYLKTLSSLKF